MKYNTKTKTKSTKTINLAGGNAYAQSPKLELASILLTTMLAGDKHYESEKQTVNKVKDLVKQIKDKKFLAQAAVYARDVFGMRSITHVLAGEVARNVQGEKWTKNFFDKIVVRADDMLEITGYLQAANDGKLVLTNPMKKGFRAAFDRFDNYQIAKYQKSRADISLVDVVNLVRPTNTPRNRDALNKLVNGKLVSEGTWETKLTQAGQKANTASEKKALKEQAWTELILERKIGYFALLKNLRNILECSDSRVVDCACELLQNEKMIKKSRVLPFRYMTAIEEIKKLSGSNSRKVIQAINGALEISVSNIPQLDGETCVVLDDSGSMLGFGGWGSRDIDEKSPAGLGSVFAAALMKKLNCDFMMFNSNARYVQYNPSDSLATITENIRREFKSGGTNFNAILQTLNKKYDRVIILSDMQGWMGGGAPSSNFAEYKRRYNASPVVYSFDLQGYGSMQFPEQNVCAIAGFSDKVFDLFAQLETDRQALVHEIEKVAI